MPEDFKRAENAGFDDYFIKPLNIKHFYKTIDEMLINK